MLTIDEILKSKKKPKEMINLLADQLKSDNKLIAGLIRCFEKGSVAGEDVP